ncbi:MAG: SMC family ATPase [Anaerolineae bacterium]|nr:SMC family ATPase [Anaerolineae bacterium]
MLPIRLEIKNFLAYRSPEPVQFEGIHLACLTGANGAGKSSLLDAITWALWGKARARRDEELVHLGQNDMYVLLEFEQDGLIYQVKRQRTRTKGGAGTLYLFAQKDDGTPNDISEPNMRATQEKINRLLNLDYETFVHSAFLQQGKADAFTTKTPRERKQILSDILGLVRWETYEEATKEKLKSIDGEIIGTEMGIKRYEDEIVQEPALIAAVAEAEQQQQDAEAAMHAAEAALKQVEHAPDEMRNAQKRQADAEQRLRHLEGDLKAADEEIVRQEQKVTRFEITIRAREEIEAGYAALEDARSTNEALGDKLMALSEIDEQRRGFERQLDAARAELEKEIGGHEATVTALERTIAAAQPDALEAIRLEIAELEVLDDERTALEENLNKLKNTRTDLDATNRTLLPEMNKLKERIDRLKAAEGAFCPLCGQPLTEDHRETLLAELQAQGTGHGDRFRTNKTRTDEIAVEIKITQDTLTNIRVRLQHLADLKGQAGEFRAGVDAAHDAELQLHAVRARLDAARATLDSEDFAADLRAQIAALDAQRNSLGYDGELHNAARQSLQTLREFESRQNELRSALEALPDAQQALEAAVARRERLLTTQAEERAQLAQLADEIAKLEILVREEQTRREEVNRQRIAERAAFRKLADAQQALKAIEDGRIRKAELEARLAQLKVKRALYDELKLAFGKNGIPAMIIETAIPELEAGANRLLNRMTDGRMSLMLTTQREKITGGVAETLDIQIADELGTRAYEMFSGGEAFRIDFALRVALSQMLARRAGAQLRTLFIDEGFGTQDEEGRNKLVEAITAIQDDFNLILVITHIEDLRDSFPVHVAIEKREDGSRISVR